MFQFVNIKSTQSSIQTWRTWPKVLGKGGVEWTEACLVVGLWPWKLSTLMKIKFILNLAMFQHAHEFRVAIHVYYNQQTLVL